jgi:spermidine synthase
VSTDDRSEASQPRIGTDDGRRALLVSGVVQSAAVEAGGELEGYWSALLPAVRPRRALILGLGGGTITQLLYRRFGQLSAVGVEIDPRTIQLAQSELGLELPGLEIVVADAIAYVGSCAERFDYLCVDLFRGSQLDRRVLARPFLRQLKALATPGAEIVFNLFQDRRTETNLQRIARVLSPRSTKRVGKNVVARFGVR